jgi:hypothetical protein
MWINDIQCGHGVMKWLDKAQMYVGEWENGQPCGLGEHNWYMTRIDDTQYTFRNTYYGCLQNGKRNGQGAFLYADSSKYEGNWLNNLKHGWVKII